MEKSAFRKKRPCDCSQEELKDFRRVVILGSQVQERGFGELLTNASWLGFCRIDDVLASVGAIKRPRVKYRDDMFMKSKSKEDSSLFVLEFGWVHTMGESAGKKLASGLADLLLTDIIEPIFATTGADNEAMRHILEKRQFHVLGNPYEGSRRVESALCEELTTKSRDAREQHNHEII